MTPNDKLTHLVTEIARTIKDDFAAANQTYMHLEITVRGRPDSDLEIAYELSNETYTNNSVSVKGGTLREVVTEFFHRLGWQRRNHPICIPHIEEETNDNHETSRV